MTSLTAPCRAESRDVARRNVRIRAVGVATRARFDSSHMRRVCPCHINDTDSNTSSNSFPVLLCNFFSIEGNVVVDDVNS